MSNCINSKEILLLLGRCMRERERECVSVRETDRESSKPYPLFPHKSVVMKRKKAITGIMFVCFRQI